MGNNELFKTIEQLKETLAEISSARQQVSDTVSAYAQTQTEIHSYTKNLMEIENVLSKLVSLLQNNEVIIGQQSETAISKLETSCNVVLDRTKVELSTISQKFAENASVNIEGMNKQIEKFSHIIEKTHQLTSKVDIISSEIRELTSLIVTLQKNLALSLTTQDKIIDDINRNQNFISDQLQTVNNAIANDIAKLNVLCSDIQNFVKSYYSNLQVYIENIRKAIEDTQQNICRETKINRYLEVVILIAIIISVALYSIK